MVLVDGAVPAPPARVSQISSNRTLEKRFTAFTCKLSVMFARTLVTTNNALDVLFCIDLRATITALRMGAVGLRAGRCAAAASAVAAHAVRRRLTALYHGAQFLAVALRMR